MILEIKTSFWGVKSVFELHFIFVRKMSFKMSPFFPGEQLDLLDEIEERLKKQKRKAKLKQK